MKHKDGKPTFHPDKSSRIVPMTIMFVVLCGFSFYLGGIFCSEKEVFVAKDVKKFESPKESDAAPLQMKSVAFPECGIDYQDYTPCTDPKVNYSIDPKLGVSFSFSGCPNSQIRSLISFRDIISVLISNFAPLKYEFYV